MNSWIVPTAMVAVMALGGCAPTADLASDQDRQARLAVAEEVARSDVLSSLEIDRTWKGHADIENTPFACGRGRGTGGGSNGTEQLRFIATIESGSVVIEPGLLTHASGSPFLLIQTRDQFAVTWEDVCAPFDPARSPLARLFG